MTIKNSKKSQGFNIRHPTPVNTWPHASPQLSALPNMVANTARGSKSRVVRGSTTESMSQQRRFAVTAVKLLLTRHYSSACATGNHKTTSIIQPSASHAPLPKKWLSEEAKHSLCVRSCRPCDRADTFQKGLGLSTRDASGVMQTFQRGV